MPNYPSICDCMPVHTTGGATKPQIFFSWSRSSACGTHIYRSLCTGVCLPCQSVIACLYASRSAIRRLYACQSLITCCDYMSVCLQISHTRLYRMIHVFVCVCVLRRGTLNPLRQHHTHRRAHTYTRSHTYARAHICCARVIFLGSASTL
jgi:hypothetical protein